MIHSWTRGFQILLLRLQVNAFTRRFYTCGFLFPQNESYLAALPYYAVQGYSAKTVAVKALQLVCDHSNGSSGAIL